jgi:hypothetical protein
VEDRPAIGVSAEMDDGEEDSLFERTQNFGHVYIVGIDRKMSNCFIRTAKETP